MDTKNNGNKLEEKVKPWKMDKSLVKIAAAYDCKVVGENNKEYEIEFYNYDGGVIEAGLSKDKFNEFPHPVGVGTNFWVVVCYINKKLNVSTWPVANFWHKSWDE